MSGPVLMVELRLGSDVLLVLDAIERSLSRLADALEPHRPGASPAAVAVPDVVSGAAPVAALVPAAPATAALVLGALFPAAPVLAAPAPAPLPPAAPKPPVSRIDVMRQIAAVRAPFKPTLPASVSPLGDFRPIAETGPDHVPAPFEAIHAWAAGRGIEFRTWDDLPVVNRKREDLGAVRFSRDYRKRA
jgi:hypothetical protein